MVAVKKGAARPRSKRRARLEAGSHPREPADRQVRRAGEQEQLIGEFASTSQGFLSQRERSVTQRPEFPPGPQRGRSRPPRRPLAAGSRSSSGSSRSSGTQRGRSRRPRRLALAAAPRGQATAPRVRAGAAPASRAKSPSSNGTLDTVKNAASRASGPAVAAGAVATGVAAGSAEEPHAAQECPRCAAFAHDRPAEIAIAQHEWSVAKTVGKGSVASQNLKERVRARRGAFRRPGETSRQNPELAARHFAGGAASRPNDPQLRRLLLRLDHVRREGYLLDLGAIRALAASGLVAIVWRAASQWTWRWRCLVAGSRRTGAAARALLSHPLAVAVLAFAGVRGRGRCRPRSRCVTLAQARHAGRRGLGSLSSRPGPGAAPGQPL